MGYQTIAVLIVVAVFGTFIHRMKADLDHILQPAVAELTKPGRSGSNPPNPKVIGQAAAEASAFGRAYGSMLNPPQQRD